MDDEKALLQVIAATPSDDFPRLVYADWLEERGRYGLVEILRRQAELRQNPSNKIRQETGKEIFRLIAAHGDEYKTFVDSWDGWIKEKTAVLREALGTAARDEDGRINFAIYFDWKHGQPRLAVTGRAVNYPTIKQEWPYENGMGPAAVNIYDLLYIVPAGANFHDLLAANLHGAARGNLHYNAMYNRADVAALLLAHGADATLTNLKDETAEARALRHDHHALAETLREHAQQQREKDGTPSL